MRPSFGTPMPMARTGEHEASRHRRSMLTLVSLSSGRRTYSLYIAYSAWYKTPRMYLSGYQPNGQPLPPHLMMEDIVGDYKDKTVTLEDFPFFANNVKMASIHPCKHASVMKTLLDRADAALKLRRERQKAGQAVGSSQGLEGLERQVGSLSVGSTDAPADNSDEWEEVQHDVADQEVAIRVDQYLVVFLKVCQTPFLRLGSCSTHANLTLPLLQFIASVTPGIEHDFTMGV